MDDALTLFQRIFRKHYALPMEHGSWIWWIGPLLLGLAVGGRPDVDALWLCLAALAGFLIRQPLTLIVKVQSNRRARSDLPPALVWASFYGLLLVLAVVALILRGHGLLLWLAVPGAPILLRYWWLVGRRAERRQQSLELLGSGVLALAAPAAYGVAGGVEVAVAWVLWVISWSQSAASIMHIYLCLEQRALKQVPGLQQRLRMGGRSLAYHGVCLLGSLALAAAGMAPWLATAAFLLVLLNALDGVLRPAIGVRPARIGLRQLTASVLFFALVMLGYRLG